MMDIEEISDRADRRYLVRAVILLVLGLLITAGGMYQYKQQMSLADRYDMISDVYENAYFDTDWDDYNGIFQQMYSHQLQNETSDAWWSYLEKGADAEKTAKIWISISGVGAALVVISLVQLVGRSRDSRSYTRYITQRVANEVHIEQTNTAIENLRIQQNRNIEIPQALQSETVAMPRPTVPRPRNMRR